MAEFLGFSLNVTLFQAHTISLNWVFENPQPSNLMKPQSILRVLLIAIGFSLGQFSILVPILAIVASVMLLIGK